MMESCEEVLLKKGRIIKGIAGFYYVHIPHEGIYECKAKGIFRKDGKKPLVGDEVKIDCLDSARKLGNLIDILPRKSELIRPAVANIDQALIIFAIVKPNPNYNLLDRFLIMMKQQGLDCLICFNKQDIAVDEEITFLKSVYEKSDNQVFFTSTKTREGMDELRKSLNGKVTAVAGPSGVGKSSMINSICGCEKMLIGEISSKNERGKNTTRHTELFAIDGLNENSYLMDTPGFSSLSIQKMEKEELAPYYPEFAPFEEECKFQGCSHINEPVCGVKNALKRGEISEIRYENYTLLYRELANQKKSYPARHD